MRHRQHPTSLLGCLVLTLFASLLGNAGRASAGEPPAVKVSNVRRVFHNGEHNAFTDLIRFGDRYYLTFRSCPDGHMVHPTASILILSSRDLRTWTPRHRFQVPLRDTRDPHFLIFKERLFVYTGTWYSGKTSLPRSQYDVNLHLGYGVWSEDGNKWHGPVMLEGTFGHYIWRAAAYGGKAYLCGRRKVNFEVLSKGEPRRMESLMLESEDGLIWRKRTVFRPSEGDETAFQFTEDGELLAIARGFGRGPAWLLRANPPYTDWKRVKLDRYIGGPLLMRWGSRWVVGGRRLQGPKAAMYWLDGQQLKSFAVLPSGGDTSYPGMVVLSPKRAAISWYSSHERDAKGRQITAIYMADLEIADESP